MIVVGERKGLMVEDQPGEMSLVEEVPLEAETEGLGFEWLGSERSDSGAGHSKAVDCTVMDLERWVDSS